MTWALAVTRVSGVQSSRWGRSNKMVACQEPAWLLASSRAEFRAEAMGASAKTRLGNSHRQSGLPSEWPRGKTFLRAPEVAILAKGLIQICLFLTSSTPLIMVTAGHDD